MCVCVCVCVCVGVCVSVCVIIDGENKTTHNTIKN